MGLNCYIIENNIEHPYSSNLLNSQINELEYLNDRDLRILRSNTRISYIAVRNKIIVVKLDNIKAIITNTKIGIIYDTENIYDMDNDYSSDTYDYNIIETLNNGINNTSAINSNNSNSNGNNSNSNNSNSNNSNINSNNSNELYFEINAFENILKIICDKFNKILNNLLPEINETIRELKIKSYKKTITLQNKITEYEFRIKEVLETLIELEKEDEDMSKMYLTKMRDVDNHSEIEEILETYRKIIDKMHNEFQRYNKELTYIINYSNLLLSSRRNDMSLINIYIGLLSLSINIGLFIISLFGMNLKNGMESSMIGFILVTIINICIVFGSYYYLFNKYNIESIKKIDN